MTTSSTPTRRAPAKKKATPAANAPDMTLAPEPQDHKSAAQKEAEGAESVTVEYEGQKFVVPLDQDDWPILAIQAMSRNMHIDGVQHLLGAQQWARFVTLFPTRRHFNAFSVVLAEALGVDALGN